MKDSQAPRAVFEIKGARGEGPRVLICAGVHGDEYEPMVAVGKLRAILAGTLVQGTVTLVPVVNAGAYFSESRYGTDGLDLARICPGNPAGTDSEVAASVISRLITEADYLVDLHTGGRLFDILPLAGYMLHGDPQVLERHRGLARAFGLPVIWGTEPSPAGRTLSVARDARVPAIYVESGGGGSFQPRVVEEYVSGCLGVLAWLGMIAGAATAGPGIRYWVEDSRPSGGYLQGKMPAPSAGIFSPAVHLGAQVRKGEVWGTLYDPLEGTSRDIHADMEGIVLLIRRAPRVQEGDSLGGILPVTAQENIRIHEG